MTAEIWVDPAGVDQLSTWLKHFVPSEGIQGKLFVCEPGESDELAVKVSDVASPPGLCTFVRVGGTSRVDFAHQMEVSAIALILQRGDPTIHCRLNVNQRL